ncbi:MAG: hypothetical protein HN576_05265 [Bacteriovoracaceae bacterium]|jgi:hypothetical protein|nr:hypothetical protein [Bacteriovoracaceae bacterium]
MFDNSEHMMLLDILENLEDERLGVELLKELNDSSLALGKKITNLDESLDNDVWKKECDELKAKLDDVIKKIKDLVQ